MESTSEQTVTKLLGRLQDGEDEARGDLYDQVYTELRQRAHRQRQRWKGEPTLQTTALVHEAYLKLVDQEEQSWTSRTHFLAVAGQAMRHVLIDRARRKKAEKRGGPSAPLSLEELKEKLGREAAMTAEDAEAFIILNEALGRLEEKNPRAARGVECRFFSGMTIEETAEALGVSTATVSRDWKQAKAWLYREMKRIRQGGANTSGDAGEGERGPKA